MVTHPTRPLYSVEIAICHCSCSRHLGIRVHCDNLAIVQIWITKNPKDKQLAAHCRTLFFIAAKNHFNISIHHLPGRKNTIADALSLQQVQRFRSLVPEAPLHSTLYQHSLLWLFEADISIYSFLQSKQLCIHSIVQSEMYQSTTNCCDQFTCNP